MKDINILYEDEQILVCVKPSGVPVQSADLRTKDMESMLKNYLSEKQSNHSFPYIGIIHRLDQPVQGVLVFAKTKEAAAGLNVQMNKGMIKKYYQAVVCGKPNQKQGSLVDYLWKDPKNNTSVIVSKDKKDSKRAELFYTVLKETDENCLLEIQLLTGRHHQIRVQMAGAGIPLVGDLKYNPHSAKSQQGSQIGLCATRLEFIHPKTKKEMVFSCKPSGESFDGFSPASEKA